MFISLIHNTYKYAQYTDINYVNKLILDVINFACCI